MDPELKDFLLLLLVSLLIGEMVGLAVLWLRPKWTKTWTKFCLNGQWKLFALGMLFFGLGAVWCWMDGKVYFAGLNLAMCLLELAALVLYGFKPLTPEMERQIDEAELRPMWRR
ncbi:MAG: hypothetical protein AB7I48_15020 [Planctomycetaceae bacterium]